MNKKKYKSDFVGDYIAFKWNVSRNELVCFSYLKAMDNYFQLEDAFDIACEAQKKNIVIVLR